MIRVDNRYDIVSGADSKGTTVFVDRRIPQFSPRLRDRNGKPANLWKYLAVHEMYEAAAMHRGDGYSHAHEKIATPLERGEVEKDGVNWNEYTKEIDGYLDKIEKEKVTRPPPTGMHVDPETAIGKHKLTHHRSHRK